MNKLNTACIHPSWRTVFDNAYATLDADYIAKLEQDQHWLPGAEQIFNAFTLPLDKVNAILFGESPYPRKQSANGYAFWDANVGEIWCPTGLSKPVNRATSLRNIIKMLLVADGQLDSSDTSQTAIACLDKSLMVSTLAELFGNFMQSGILLLNTTPVLSTTKVAKEAKYWSPFISELLAQIANQRPNVQLLLWGKVAESIKKIPNIQQIRKVCSEHPYNISFISNPDILQFFAPLQLLKISNKIHKT